MSGIYIPGIDIPERCAVCSANYDYQNFCSLVGRRLTPEEWFDSRPTWCPLIPVPDHGRLIDADELKRTFCEECLLYPDKCLKEMCDRQGPYHIEHMVNIIIPADKEDAYD